MRLTHPPVQAVRESAAQVRVGTSMSQKMR